MRRWKIKSGKKSDKRKISRDFNFDLENSSFRKEIFSSGKDLQLNTQQKKNENMQFLLGSKIWRENFKNIFLQKKKKNFSIEIYF